MISAMQFCVSNAFISRCSKLIAIKLCAISEMHAKVRRESVAGYATDIMPAVLHFKLTVADDVKCYFYNDKTT